ncbi:serine/threonine-protein kinase [Lentisphaera marina]|uniref:serine/threonine-protein kinase n=1 Tax=Lentisphaera marina TaxID=1111041 RepID=UPI0023661BF6|nr:serine/threonine-protein kinase [Lentisphaera marina]MDD7983684.1 serine/threonine-protein kinase [Lentisphaera marina]
MPKDDLDLQRAFDKTSELIADFYHEEKKTPPSRIQELNIPLSPINSSKFDKQHQIDTGGMKDIFEVVDRDTTRHLAMAVPKSNNKEDWNDFIFEARVTALLEHPNIVPVHDIGLYENRPCFTMKLINGDTLTQIIKRFSQQGKQAPSTLHDLINIFLKVCDALAYAHSKDVLHLDLKPDNIRISDYGEVQVLDWGLAQFYKTSDFHTRSHTQELSIIHQTDTKNLDGIILGSPAYMSPEQACADYASPRSDIYSLGAILYSIITLQPPFVDDDYRRVLKKTIKGDFPKPSELKLNWSVDPGLEAICLKAMALKSRDRYKLVSDLAEDLRKWNSGYAPLALNAPPLHLTKLFLKRNKLLLALSLGFLLVIFISTIVSYNNLSKSEALAKINAKKASDALDDLEVTQRNNRENFRKLMNSRVKIQETIDKLHEVSEEKITIAQIAADQFIQDAYNAFNQGAFAKAKLYANQAQSLAPDYKAVINLFGKINLLEFNLAEANKYFLQIDKIKYAYFDENKIKKGNVEEILRLIKTIQEDKSFNKHKHAIFLGLKKVRLSKKSIIRIFQETLLKEGDELTPNRFVTSQDNFPIFTLSILPIKEFIARKHLKTLNKQISFLKSISYLELHNQVNIPLRQLTLMTNINTMKLNNCQINAFIWSSHKDRESLENLILIDSPLADYAPLLKISSLQKLSLNKSSNLKKNSETAKLLREKGIKIEFIQTQN